MNTCRLPLAATSIGAVLLLATGCGGDPPLLPTPVPPTTHIRPVPVPDPPSALTVSVSGSVTDGSGDAASLVVLSFDSSTDRGASRSTISDQNGDYTVSLKPGHYTVSCTSLDGACSPADADGDDSMAMDVTTADTVDFVVESEAPAPDPEPQPDPPGPPSGDDLAVQCRAGGYNVCGRVTQGGRPVAGAILEAKFQGQHQAVTTNDNGLYALKMQLPDAVLLCEGTEEMMSNAVDCSVAGESSPVYIDSTVTGRIVNFAAGPS